MDDIREAVFASRRQLENVYKAHGKMSVFDYALRTADFTPDPANAKRNELIGVIGDIARPVFGEERMKHLIAYFEHSNYVSTADHHGPLSLPSFLHGNIVQAEANRARGENTTVVFSTASISLDNHSLPRGLAFHADGREKRILFFSLRSQHQPVYAMQSYAAGIAKAIDRASGILPKSVIKKLKEIYLDGSVLKQKDYCDQISATNFKLFREISGNPDANFFMIPQESIVAELIVRHHISGESRIHDLIFIPKYREAFKKYFNGVQGGFDLEKKRGTFLFWGMRDSMRIRLMPEHDELVSDAGDFRIKLEPDAIAKALREKSIMPSGALCLIVLSFYYGLAAGGGYSQVDYLTKMKQQYRLLLAECGHEDEARGIEMLVTDHFGSDYLFAYRKSTAIFPMTALDMLIAGERLYPWIASMVKEVTVAEAIDNVLPDIYKILTGEIIEAKPDARSIFE